jgi:glycosyltransferase involved in cell wall biosynthesis
MPDFLEREPIAGAPLSVVLLAHNEGPSFEETVTAWLDAAKALQREYEVLLVKDGSNDETTTGADAIAGRHAEIRVIHHAQRRGLGAGLRAGLAAARFPLYPPGCAPLACCID